MNRKRDQRGLSLIEVLVSMLVMGLGLVGMAALQANTLKYQQGSVQRGAVASLISDFAGRLQANVTQGPGALQAASPFIKTQTWTVASGNTEFEPGVDCEAAASAGGSSGASSVSCTAAQRADYDLTTWLAQVREALPNGSASIARTSSGEGLVVTLMWADKDYATDGASGRQATQVGAVDWLGPYRRAPRFNQAGRTCCSLNQARHTSRPILQQYNYFQPN